MKKSHQLNYYCVFTVIFIFTVFFTFFAYILNGKTLIWNVDGLQENFVSFRYFREYYLTILRGIFSGNFYIPMFDFTIGEGSDILTTLAWNGLWDPLNFLSVFVKEEYLGIGYSILIILRMFLAGIFFLRYCFYHRKEKLPTLCGSLVYCFCGFALHQFVQPYFMVPLLMFPLIITELEKLYYEKKNTGFILSVFLLAISNFYFLYMITALVGIWTICLFICDKYKFREAIKLLIKIIAYYFIAIALSAFTLLPVCIAFFNNGRSGSSYSILDSIWHYDMASYFKMFIGMFVPFAEAVYGTDLNYPAVAILVLFFMWRIKKECTKHLKLIFVVLTIILIVPFGGSIMNGFSYTTNRWTFAYSFVIAIFVVDYLYDMFKIPVRRIISLFIAELIILVIFIYQRIYINHYVTAGLIILIGTTGLLIFINIIYRDQQRFYYGILILSFVCINIILNGYYRYHENQNGYVKKFVDINCVSNIYNFPQIRIQDLQHDQFFRVGIDNDSIYNRGMALGYKGISIYESIIHENFSDFYKEFNLVTMKDYLNMKGYDNSIILDSLNAVVFKVSSDPHLELPEEFTLYYQEDQTRCFENPYAAPLGFVYDKAITYNEFKSFSPVEKMEILTQRVVLSSEKGDGSTPVLESYLAEYRLEEKNSEYNNGILTIGEGGGNINFYFDVPENNELYIRFKNFDVMGKQPERLNVQLACNGKIRDFSIVSCTNKYKMDENDYLVNMGYSEHERTECNIIFDQQGSYKLDEIEIIVLPVNNVMQNLDCLNRIILEDAKISGNYISTNIIMKEAGYLYLNIPDIGGWQLWVNGEKSKYVNANIKNIAIYLSAGSYDIELRYRTPGFICGWFISLITALTAILIKGYISIKRKRLYETD